MKLAAIDIGSNAVRLQITNVIAYGGNVTLKKLQYLRFPLRLGEDVFSIGCIGERKVDQFLKLMQSFKILIDLFEVDDSYACATSAMREATNGGIVKQKIYDDCGLEVNIISGDEEAELINRVISFHLSNNANTIHIDVGGGSTELNLYKGLKISASRSFPIGSVRLLNKQDHGEAWKKMKTWITEHLPGSADEVFAIGTGGNIGKIFDLAEGIKGQRLTIKKLENIKEQLEGMSIKERTDKLQLNVDRADVIVPAANIYLQAMIDSGANKILVPDVGLKDGIMTYLYDRNLTKINKS